MVLSFTRKCDALTTDGRSIARNAVNAILMSSEAVGVFSAFIIYLILDRRLDLQEFTNEIM